jgi:uncharacterized membrane protein
MFLGRAPRLVPTDVKHAHARQLAHREFGAHFAGDKATRECILFFVSFGERYVEIIADHETHARVPSNVWNKMIGDFTAAVAAGRVGTDCSARSNRAARF